MLQYETDAEKFLVRHICMVLCLFEFKKKNMCHHIYIEKVAWFRHIHTYLVWSKILRKLQRLKPVSIKNLIENWNGLMEANDILKCLHYFFLDSRIAGKKAFTNLT